MLVKKTCPYCGKEFDYDTIIDDNGAMRHATQKEVEEASVPCFDCHPTASPFHFTLTPEEKKRVQSSATKQGGGKDGEN